MNAKIHRHAHIYLQSKLSVESIRFALFYSINWLNKFCYRRPRLIINTLLFECLRSKLCHVGSGSHASRISICLLVFEVLILAEL